MKRRLNITALLSADSQTATWVEEKEEIRQKQGVQRHCGTEKTS